MRWCRRSRPVYDGMSTAAAAITLLAVRVGTKFGLGSGNSKGWFDMISFETTSFKRIVLPYQVGEGSGVT